MIERHHSSLSFAAALVVLTAAGVAGNAFGVPLFFGVDFLLGSIATLIVARLYGPAWGTLSAAIASAYTLVLWQHPYAALIFTLEVLVVGLLARGGRRNLFLADGLFWLVAGVPLVWLFYGLVLGVGPGQTWLIALKDAVNGIFNALIAGLIVEHAVLARRARGPGGSAVPFRRILFNVLAALVLFPAMLLLVLDSDREAQAVEQAIAAQLRNDAQEITGQLRRWQERRLHALRELAAIAGPSPVPSARLQDAAEVVQRAVPDFRVVGVTDTAGRVVAASPPTTLPAGRWWARTTRHGRSSRPPAPPCGRRCPTCLPAPPAARSWY